MQYIYGFKYTYLMPIICKQLYSFKYSDLQLILCVGTDQGVMTMKEYSLLPSVSEVETDHHMQFSVIPRIHCTSKRKCRLINFNSMSIHYESNTTV